MIERINLVPGPPLALRIQRIVLVCVIGVILVAFLPLEADYLSLKGRLSSVDLKISSIRGEVAAMEETAAHLTGLKARVRDLEGRKARLEKLVEALEPLRRFVPDYTGVLRGVAEALSGRARISELSVRGGAGTLEGRTTAVDQVPVFLERLQNTSLFESVSLGEIVQSKEKEGQVYIFRVRFSLKKNEPLRGRDGV